MGTLGILSVGAGDTKLTFDPNNPAERIRSARIVSDMLRRGYALLIEDPPGSGSYVRATAFNEATCEYIIADFDPITAAKVDGENHEPIDVPAIEPAAAESIRASVAKTGATTSKPKPGAKRGPKSRTVPASTTSGIAVSRSAGG